MDKILERLPFRGVIDNVVKNVKTSITLVLVALVVSCVATVLMATMMGATKPGTQMTKRYADGFKGAAALSLVTSALLIWAAVNGFVGFKLL